MFDSNYQVSQTHPTSEHITIIDKSNSNCFIIMNVRTKAIKMSVLPKYLSVTRQDVFSFCDMRRRYYQFNEDSAFEVHADGNTWLSKEGFDEFIQFIRRNSIAIDTMVTKLISINDYALRYIQRLETDNTWKSFANQMSSSTEASLRREIDDLKHKLSELTKRFNDHLEQHEANSSTISLPMVDNKTIICNYIISFIQHDSSKAGMMITVNYEEEGIKQQLGIDKPLLEIKARCSIENVQSVLSDVANKGHITLTDADHFTVTEANKDKAFSAFKYKLRSLLRKNKEDVVSNH